MSRPDYAALLAPGRIGALDLRNRTVVTAMGVSFAEEDGTCGERLIAYHEEQARGGVGLIIMGATGVAWPVGAVQRNQIAISDDRFIPGLRRLAEAVHRHGGRIAAQLHQGGLNASFAAAAFGEPLWAPSLPKPPAAAGDFLDAFLPEEMDRGAMSAPQVRVLDEAGIALLTRQFAEAAARAREAGLDGVEIHGGHGYILSSFLSPSTNRRTDQYGGPLENRARLMVEVVRAVRAAVGPDFAVWGKLDWREVGKPDGITLEDAKATARMVEAAGADAITVSAYHDVAFGKNHTESYLPHTPEANIPAAAAIKAVLGVPVIASGRITPASASAKIAAGQFDFLAMGRLLLADPHLPAKLAAGRADEIRPCINCYTCVSCIYVGAPTRCAVNPETGLEYLRSQGPAAARRRFVVVGGGPAGMEAALRLDAAGQDVILVEKGERLGGTLQFAALAYEPNEGLLDWLRDRIARSGVEVRLRTQADVALVTGLAPDEVFVATGAVRETPPIPGADLPHVFSGDDLRALMLGEAAQGLERKTGLGARIAAKVGAVSGLTANLDFVRQATRRWMPLGQRIVIIGGELVGLELAEFLIERGRRVSVLEESANFGRGLTMVRRARLIPELVEHGAALYAGAGDIAITPEAVAFVDREGRAQSVAADHVVVAKGARGDSALADQLRAAGLKVRAFGDGAGVGYIEGAIRGAAEAVTARLG